MNVHEQLASFARNERRARNLDFGGADLASADLSRLTADALDLRLADLRGAAFAFNEPTSHSGYALPRYALASRGETNGLRGSKTASVTASRNPVSLR